MNFLANLIFLRLLSGLKSSNIILFIGFVYLGFLVFNGNILLLKWIYIAVCVILVVGLIVAHRPKETQRGAWADDPEIVAYREYLDKQEKKKQKKDNENPYE